MLPLVVWSEPLITFVYGERYSGASGPLRILVAASALRVGVAVLSARAQATDRLSYLGWTQSFGLALTAGVALLLIPMYGMSGAALATLIGQAACLLVLATDRRKRSAT